MDLSIIIVNYNVRELLVRCLESIYTNIKEISFEIIVVDNNSSDYSIETVKSVFPGVVLIKNKSNMAFAGANNQGIKIARGDYIFLINPDAFLIDVSFSKMLKFAMEKDNDVLVAPKLLNNDGTLQHSAWKFHVLRDIVLESVFINKLFNQKYPLEDYSSPVIVDAVSGAAMLFSRELAMNTGGFDNNLFWMEDVDLCKRIKVMKGRVFYFPDSLVVHLIGQSSKKNLKIVYSNQLISKLKFIRKQGSMLRSSLAVIFTCVHIFNRLVLLSIISVFVQKSRKVLSGYLYALQKLSGYLLFSDQSPV